MYCCLRYPSSSIFRTVKSLFLYASHKLSTSQIPVQYIHSQYYYIKILLNRMKIQRLHCALIFLISNLKYNIASYNHFCKNIRKNRHIILIRRKINYQTHFIDYNFRLNILFSGIFRIVKTLPGKHSRGVFHNKIPRYSRIAPVTVFPAPAEPGDDDCTANATDHAQ